MRPTRFCVLDSCRGLCAVAVVLFHLDTYTHWYWLPVIRNGYVAVDFFFVLSGFVIASAYQATLETFADAIRYAIRRFGRLYPLHLAVLLASLIIEFCRLWILRANDAFTNNTNVIALFEHLALIQGFTANHETWNYPAWSISIELWINLAFGAFVVALGRRLLAGVAVVAASLAVFVVVRDQLPFSTASAPALLDALHALLEFSLGVLAFAAFARLKERGLRPSGLLEVLVVPLIVGAFGYADALDALGLPSIFAIVVFVFGFEAGPISRALSHVVFRRLGAISYSIYLTHSLYLGAIDAAVPELGRILGIPACAKVGDDVLLTLGGPWAMDGLALACIAAVLFASSLTHGYIEEPARRYFNLCSDRFDTSGPSAMTEHPGKPLSGETANSVAAMRIADRTSSF